MDKFILLQARLTPAEAVAIKVAAAKAGKTIQQLLGEAVRRHPGVVKELAALQPNSSPKRPEV